jgi:hypothetical protein
MKKMILLLGLLVPAAVWAQTKTPGQEPKKSLPLPIARDAGKLYMQLVLAETTSGSTSIRMDFGRDQLRAISDKDFLTLVEESSSYVVNSVPDAMNYLNSIGFQYVDSYPVSFRDRSETRLISKRKSNARYPRAARKCPRRGGAQDRPPGRSPNRRREEISGISR